MLVVDLCLLDGTSKHQMYNWGKLWEVVDLKKKKAPLTALMALKMYRVGARK